MPEVMSDSESLIDKLKIQLSALQKSFELATQGRTICQIGRENDLDISVKILEGRMQALIDIMRCVEKTKEINMKTCLDKKLKKWNGLSDISEAWRVYKNAGLEMLEEVRNSMNLKAT